ncbi:MAG: bifunctional adenosylcobinamide kinase/adenosylcobinamide-phosphate guanylyltransferase [Gammaproteobacteria bacterium]|nr:bifunctional adenosylcobinamide kinase/adenosylcobinamide-phosphate guanylyltransferase [Gammaproteobacteria bacterium]
MIELILGGARSGKSAYAQQQATASKQNVIYIATATGDDQEMQLRIRRHQQERPSHWQVIEEPIALAQTLKNYASTDTCLLVDCLTLWLSNLLGLDDEDRLQLEIAQLYDVVQELPGTVLLVSNETGLGIIPMGELTRRYCDEAGLLHQKLAALSDSVIFMLAGLPQKIK